MITFARAAARGTLNAADGSPDRPSDGGRACGCYSVALERFGLFSFIYFRL